MTNTRKPSLILPPNRRQVLRGLGAGALGLGALGMAGHSGAFAQIGGNGDWRRHEGTDLRLLVVNHWWTDAIRARLPEFEELTGMSVTLDILSEDNYYQRAAVELSAGTSSYDGLMVGNLQAGQYMAAGWLAPLGDLLSDADAIDQDWYDIEDIFASGRQAGTSGDQLHALPVSTECEVVIYRRDLFEQAGIGEIRSFDDLIDAAGELNGNGMAGIVGRGRRGLDVVWVWTGYLLGYGGDFFANGQAALNSSAAMEAADAYLNRLLRENGPPGTANMSWLEASDLFKTGGAGIFTDASGQLAVVLDPASSQVVDAVDTFAWPSHGDLAPAPNYWFWLFGIPARTRNPEAAALFVAWATSPEVSLQVGSETGSPVARQSVWDNEAFTQFYPGNSAAEVSRSLASVQADRVPFGDPQFPQVVDALSVELVNILTGSKDVEAAMTDANTAVDQILNS